MNFVRYECLQPHYNLVHRAEFERQLADICREYSLGVMPYSPLGGGFLTGKYDRESHSGDSTPDRGVQKHFSESNWRLLEKMGAIAAENGGGSISQVALAWLLADPVITSPIIGPRTLDQLQDNLGAGSFRLTDEEIEILDEASDWKG